MGGLQLHLGSTRRLIGMFALNAGEIDTPLPIPASAAFAGRIEHYQGILFDDDGGSRGLTNKVSVRYLP